MICWGRWFSWHRSLVPLNAVYLERTWVHVYAGVKRLWQELHCHTQRNLLHKKSPNDLPCQPQTNQPTYKQNAVQDGRIFMESGHKYNQTPFMDFDPHPLITWQHGFLRWMQSLFEVSLKSSPKNYDYLISTKTWVTARAIFGWLKWVPGEVTCFVLFTLFNGRLWLDVGYRASGVYIGHWSHEWLVHECSLPDQLRLRMRRPVWVWVWSADSSVSWLDLKLQVINLSAMRSG